MKRLLFLFVSLLCIFSSIANPNISNSHTITPSDGARLKNPSATPEVITSRLQTIDAAIEMRYSKEVQSYIDTYLKAYGRKQLSNLLGRSAFYLPIFERALKEAGLPQELKYLPVIESNLDAKATSSQGAAGLWQFMPIAARGYDMKMTSAIDERRDPYLSSERACKMLKDLYDKFGDWSLAVAAFNCGPGRVQSALKRAGGDKSKHNFWTLINYLPAQTRKYVPKLIAMTYLMTFHSEHDIAPAAPAPETMAADTVHISSQMSLRQIASMVNVPVEELKKLNPHYKSEMIPATASRHCNLVLPSRDAAGQLRARLGHPEVKDYPQDAKPAVKNAPQPKETKPARPKRTSVYAYEDKPSQMFPNTFVRTKKRQKEDSETVDNAD